MSDPFQIAKDQVQQSVQGMVSLYDRWKKLLETSNTTTNEEFQWTQNELKNVLKSIETDLDDLNEVVSALESGKARILLEAGELQLRRAFINETRKKVHLVRDDIASVKTKAKLDKDTRELLMSASKGSSYNKDEMEKAVIADNQNFIEGQQQAQLQIKQQQDQKLTLIHDNIQVLKQMGNDITVAIEEQDQLVDQMGTEINKADSGLKGSIKKLSELIDKTKDSTQWGIIIILICVTVGLLVAVFYI